MTRPRLSLPTGVPSDEVEGLCLQLHEIGDFIREIVRQQEATSASINRILHSAVTITITAETASSLKYSVTDFFGVKLELSQEVTTFSIENSMLKTIETETLFNVWSQHIAKVFTTIQARCESPPQVCIVTVDEKTRSQIMHTALALAAHTLNKDPVKTIGYPNAQKTIDDNRWMEIVETIRDSINFFDSTQFSQWHKHENMAILIALAATTCDAAQRGMSLVCCDILSLTSLVLADKFCPGIQRWAAVGIVDDYDPATRELAQKVCSRKVSLCSTVRNNTQALTTLKFAAISYDLASGTNRSNR